MAIIRNTASALRYGKVGNETYYVAQNKQVVRVAQNDSNYGDTASRTVGQQDNRVRWANLVQFYKLSKGWMRKAFENKKAGQSDYNRFMQLNLANARIYFTKKAVAACSCIVDDFIVSQGSLRQINITQVGNTWATDIQLGSLTIGAATTIADFTTAILQFNNWAKVGMQISFISYQQTTDSLGYPVVICTAYELTLSTTDTRLVRSFLPEFCSQTSASGTLATNNNISVGGFAYILSQTIGGKTLVSTQKLVTDNVAFVQLYSGEQMRELAIRSYGLNEASFLDSGSNPVTRAEQPVYITGATIEGNINVWSPGLAGPPRSAYSEKNITLFFSTPLPEGAVVSRVNYDLETLGIGNAQSAQLSADRRSVTAYCGENDSTSRTISFSVIVDGVTYNIMFDNTPEIHE